MTRVSGRERSSRPRESGSGRLYWRPAPGPSFFAAALRAPKRRRARALRSRPSSSATRAMAQRGHKGTPAQRAPRAPLVRPDATEQLPRLEAKSVVNVRRRSIRLRWASVTAARTAPEPSAMQRWPADRAVGRKAHRVLKVLRARREHPASTDRRAPTELWDHRVRRGQLARRAHRVRSVRKDLKASRVLPARPALSVQPAPRGRRARRDRSDRQAPPARRDLPELPVPKVLRV